MAGFSTKKVKKTRQAAEDPVGLLGTDGAEDVVPSSFSTKGQKAGTPEGPKRPKGHVWSPHQRAIFSACEESNASLIIEALAGTGKTTTVIEAVKHLTGKTLLCAFNKRIADELGKRLSGGSDAVNVSTLHGLGYRLVQRTFPNTQVDSMRGLGLALAGLKSVGGPISKNYQWMVKDAASICKEISPYLVSEKVHPDDAAAQAGQIALSYGHFDRIDPRLLDVCSTAVVESMRLALDVQGSIDYSDMLFVPLHKIASAGEYDNVIVDEAQDMNAAQLYLAQQVLKKETGRLIVVGDRHQAIYGFRGADTGSMDRLREKFSATVLKLPVSYRCPAAVIAEAQRFVSDIEAAPGTPAGSVEYIGYSRMVRDATSGDFILSRLNAPLLRLCLMFIKEGRPAVVEGRDIGKGLINVINKMTFGNPTVGMQQFLSALKVWQFKTIERANSNDDADLASRTQDQCEALQILSEDCSSMADLKGHIERLFDDTEGKSSKIVCSTVHKAKGLESNRVFILCDTFKGGWEGGTGEEANLKYVAITRSKSILTYVDHPDPPKQAVITSNTLSLATPPKDHDDVPF